MPCYPFKSVRVVLIDVMVLELEVVQEVLLHPEVHLVLHLDLGAVHQVEAALEVVGDLLLAKFIYNIVDALG